MYLPIAILYNDSGIAFAVRYYVFDEAIKADYNAYNQAYLPTSTVKQGRIVEVPIERLTRTCQNGRSGYARSDSHRYILLGELAGVTKVGSEGEILYDYTQLIVPKNVCISEDSVIYAIDFKGNVIGFPNAQLVSLIRSRGLTIGNPNTLDIIYRQAKEVNKSGIYANYSEFSYECVLSPYEKQLNKYRVSLNALYTLQGLGSRTREVSEDFTMERIAGECPILMIPKGITTIDLDTEGVRHGIRTIVCPSEATSMHYSGDDVLERFVCPQTITAGFKLNCHSVDNLTLPERVLGLDCPERMALFELFLQSFSDEKINFASGTCVTEVYVNKAPNLKNIDIDLLPCQPVSRHKPLEVYTYITLYDAPALQEIKISPQASVFGDKLNKLYRLDVNVAAKEYTIVCELPVTSFKLRIPTLNHNCTINIQHCGIDVLSYISHTKNVTLNIKGGKPKKLSIDQEGVILGSQNVPTQINYL